MKRRRKKWAVDHLQGQKREKEWNVCYSSRRRRKKRIQFFNSYPSQWENSLSLVSLLVFEPESERERERGRERKKSKGRMIKMWKQRGYAHYHRIENLVEKRRWWRGGGGKKVGAERRKEVKQRKKRWRKEEFVKSSGKSDNSIAMYFSRRCFKNRNSRIKWLCEGRFRRGLRVEVRNEGESRRGASNFNGSFFLPFTRENSTLLAFQGVEFSETVSFVIQTRAKQPSKVDVFFLPSKVERHNNRIKNSPETFSNGRTRVWKSFCSRHVWQVLCDTAFLP